MSPSGATAGRGRGRDISSAVPPAQSESLGRPVRLRGIEGLRGIAAMTVLVGHVMQYAPEQLTGWVARLADDLGRGLTLFFVLSGFLLYRPFAATIVSGQPRPSLRRYAEQRVRRIYPGYLVIWSVTAFVAGVAFLPGATHLSRTDAAIGYLTDPVTIVSDLLLVHMYIPGQLLTGIGPAWSLVSEIAFYASMPATALLVLRLRRPSAPSSDSTTPGSGVTLRSTIAALLPPALFIGVGMATCAWLQAWARTVPAQDLANRLWGQDGTSILARSILANAALFGLGMATAVGHVLLTRGHSPGRLGGAVWTSVAIVALAVDLSGHGGFFGTTVGAFGFAILILSVTTSWTRFGNVLEGRAVRYLGMISYSVYLWHVPVIWFLIAHGLTIRDAPLGWIVSNSLLVICVSIALSTATYYLVERPGMTYRRR